MLGFCAGIHLPSLAFSQTTSFSLHSSLKATFIDCPIHWLLRNHIISVYNLDTHAHARIVLIIGLASRSFVGRRFCIFPLVTLFIFFKHVGHCRTGSKAVQTESRILELWSRLRSSVVMHSGAQEISHSRCTMHSLASFSSARCTIDSIPLSISPRGCIERAKSRIKVDNGTH